MQAPHLAPLNNPPIFRRKEDAKTQNVPPPPLVATATCEKREERADDRDTKKRLITSPLRRSITVAAVILGSGRRLPRSRAEGERDPDRCAMERKRRKRRLDGVTSLPTSRERNVAKKKDRPQWRTVSRL